MNHLWLVNAVPCAGNDFCDWQCITYQEASSFLPLEIMTVVGSCAGLLSVWHLLTHSSSELLFPSTHTSNLLNCNFLSTHIPASITRCTSFLLKVLSLSGIASWWFWMFVFDPGGKAGESHSEAWCHPVVWRGHHQNYNHSGVSLPPALWNQPGQWGCEYCLLADVTGVVWEIPTVAKWFMYHYIYKSATEPFCFYPCLLYF